MARKKKGRATKNNIQASDSAEPDELRKAPHSFVITRGNVSGYVQELTKDFRKVMEPYTASSIKSRKKNTLKDFVSVAGPLQVSHLCMMTQTELGVYLRVARLPRGPTLTMRVHSYCLSRDVRSSLKKTVTTDKMFTTAPLVVLNSFSGEGMHLKLLSSTFQNMFPSINLTKIKLSNVRRCVLLSYDPETKLIDFRHYAIRAVPVGLTRGIKKLVQAKVPDLSRYDDISEYLTKGGNLSESEAEDDPNSHVELPQDLASRGNMAASQSAVRLVELGPRMTLQLVKVEEGLMEGEVMFHEYVQKTEEEKVAIRKIRAQKKHLKEKRRKEQNENTKRKQEEKEAHKKRSLKGTQKNDAPAEEFHDDDAAWYRSEVGEEPDKDLFEHIGQKRKPRDHDQGGCYGKKPKYGEDKSKSQDRNGTSTGGMKKSVRFQSGSTENKGNYKGKNFKPNFSHEQQEDRPFKSNGKYGNKSASGKYGSKSPSGKFGNKSPAGKFGNKSFEGKGKFQGKSSGGKYNKKSAGGRTSHGNGKQRKKSR